VTDATTSGEARPEPERDDEERGGPAHPAPGHLPPEPEPDPEPGRDEDDDGGPAHPAPGHLPPASPEHEQHRS
jgi:hypothetical protein